MRAWAATSVRMLRKGRRSVGRCILNMAERMKGRMKGRMDGWMERKKDVNSNGDGESDGGLVVVVKMGGKGRAIRTVWLRRRAYLQYPSPPGPRQHTSYVAPTTTPIAARTFPSRRLDPDPAPAHPVATRRVTHIPSSSVSASILETGPA